MASLSVISSCVNRWMTSKPARRAELQPDQAALRLAPARRALDDDFIDTRMIAMSPKLDLTVNLALGKSNYAAPETRFASLVIGGPLHRRRRLRRTRITGRWLLYMY